MDAPSMERVSKLPEVGEGIFHAGIVGVQIPNKSGLTKKPEPNVYFGRDRQASGNIIAEYPMYFCPYPLRVNGVPIIIKP